MAKDEPAEVKKRREKAEEFLLLCELALDMGAYNAAVSLAVSASIQASDVLQLLAGMQPQRGTDHSATVPRLRSAAGDAAAQQLRFVLGLKSKAQYDSQLMSKTEAEEALKRATRLVQKSKGL